MNVTKPRMAAEERRRCVVGAACRVFAKSSYRGATTATESAKALAATKMKGPGCGTRGLSI